MASITKSVKQKKEGAPIPKQLHVIWLGGLLRDAGKKNVVAWKLKNPDYIMNLWIDSRTFVTQELKQAYDRVFLPWARKNKIKVSDINPIVKKGFRIYNGMESKQFYDDELLGEYPNYAAASDILRVEILYKLGGVYFDAEDVFPGEKSFGDLNAVEGFLIEQKKSLMNDLMGSVKMGRIICKYREKINANYRVLYKGPIRDLLAHQNECFENFRTMNGRLMSTCLISGPLALFDTLQALELASKKLCADDSVKIDPIFFRLAEKNASSWFDTRADSRFGVVIAVFRSNAREYLNVLMDHYIKISHSKMKTLLEIFQKALNSLPPTKNFITLFKQVESKISAKEVAILNENIKIGEEGFFDYSKNFSEKIEKFLLYCKYARVDPSDLSALIKSFGKTLTDDDFNVEWPLSQEGCFLHFMNKIFPEGFYKIIQHPYLRDGFLISLLPGVVFSEEQMKHLDRLVGSEMILLKESPNDFVISPL